MTLQERLDAAIAAQQAIVDQSRAAGSTELSEDQQRDFNAQQTIINDLRAQISAEANNAAAVEAARTAERARISEITSMCRDFGMSDADIRGLIDNAEITIEGAREHVLTHLKAHGMPASVRVTEDEGDKFRSAAADGLCLRAGISVDNPASGANEFRAMSLRDLAIESLAREGKSDAALRRMDSTDLLREFFNPTSAFPSILDNTINKAIVKLYNAVPTTFQAWTQKGSLRDFKSSPDHEYVIGGAGEFKKVSESGELEHDKPSDSKLPTRKLETYGRTFSMSRQAFINDDIGFITEIPGLYAASAKKTIDKQVYSLLFNNSTIFDNKTLFHADHGNLIASGAAPSQATIQAAILKMQRQKDQFNEPITMVPAFIIVGVGYEFDLAVLFNSAQVTGSSNNDINPLYNYPLKVVQTPQLNALAGANACPWFLASDPMSAKSIQVDYLNGIETPTIRRMETPGTLGFNWGIYLDWGINVRDYRGILKNPGAVIS